MTVHLQTRISYKKYNRVVFIILMQFNHTENNELTCTAKIIVRPLGLINGNQINAKDC